MSFILDALRKSETERQRQASPSLADAQYHVNKTRRSIWVPVLIAVLAANLIIVAYLIFSDSGGTKDTSELTDEPASGLVERPPAGSSEEVVIDAEKPVEVAIVTNTVESRESVVVESPEPTWTPPPTPPEPVPEQINLPSMQQLILSGQISLAPLHVDIHVFAGAPEKRFIFINMNKYREGDQLEEGPTVERIVDTGVILQHQGNRFTLNRE